MMRHRWLTAVLAAVLWPAGSAQAHPVPFTYLDVRLQPASVDLTLVAHIIDVAHDLSIEPPERLLDEATLKNRSADVVRLLSTRMRLTADRSVLDLAEWETVVPLPERQSVRLEGRARVTSLPGVLGLEARMFPYDPMHQTFVNFYEGDALNSQAILDAGRTRIEYFSGTPRGVLAVVRQFVPTGMRHILLGPDHLLFLLGLLLLGGSLHRLSLIVTAFTIAQTVTLSLAAFHIVSPPGRLIEPAISLSIVYVGLDNLMVRGGRDVRLWIAAVFGLFHGFGFAPVLRGMDLPRRALGWSLVSFNVGVEVGQLVAVVVVATALTTLNARNETAGRRMVTAGSIGVIAGGAFWFIRRVFFSGGV